MPLSQVILICPKLFHLQIGMTASHLATQLKIRLRISIMMNIFRTGCVQQVYRRSQSCMEEMTLKICPKEHIALSLASVRHYPLLHSHHLDRLPDFPVLPYKGTKSFVISTVSWIGGKNPFLGWAYVAAASVFVLLAILGTARHLIKPRFDSIAFSFRFS